MFTKKQLDLLLTVQYQDDWHVNYFSTVLKDWDSEIDSRERNALLQYVSSLSPEQVWNLQMALNHLNLLPSLKA